MKKLIIITLVIFFINSTFAQLAVNPNQTAQQLVQNVLIGSGVSVSNITFTGSPSAIGSFTGGASTNLGITSGIIMSTGLATDAVGPNSSGSTSTNFNLGGDPQLNALITQSVNDAAVIEFDFVPLGDTLRFEYVFGSDEYPEFVNSFNDVFGFFVSGPNPAGGNYLHENIATIPGTTTPVTINNINNGTNNTGPCINCQYYVNNTGGITVEYDGFTTVLTAEVLVIPCMTYHFKLAIGDAGDNAYDSGVFLKENSFSTDAVTVETDFSLANALPYAIEGCNDVIITATLPKLKPNDYIVYIDTMWGTATNGVDFPMIYDSIVVPSGSLSSNFTLAPYADGIAEPTENFNFVIQTSPCTIDTINVDIYNYSPLSLKTITSDTLICEDSAMLMIDIMDGHPPYIYNWSPQFSLSDPSIKDPIAYPTQTTNYIISVTDSTGCPAIVDSVMVTVSPKPDASFYPAPIKGCEPLRVIFQDQSAPNIANWFWDFGDGNTSTASNPDHFYYAGTYTVSLHITTDDGCRDSLVVSNLINAYPQPKANFDATPPVTNIDNPTINFTDRTNNSQFWFWDFGDNIPGDTSSLQNPSYTYSDEGGYTVMLIAYNQHGCADTAYKDVRVIIDEITIPNVITPNGDGYNDVFHIENIEKLEASTLLIYNRWGKKVYEANNYRNDWDGDNLADGVYFYVLKYDTFFESREASGTVTIMRKR